MTPHETPPPELIKNIILVRKLCRMWTNSYPGADREVVDRAYDYACAEIAKWLNNPDFVVTMYSSDSFKIVTRRLYRELREYHGKTLEEIRIKLRALQHLYDRIELIKTLPFAMHYVAPEKTQYFVMAQMAFKRYWHLDYTPDWTYEQMCQMLETRELIEVIQDEVK